MAGNMCSRWTDFLITDGEKEDRHRDTEFELINDSYDSLIEYWEKGWQILFEAIEPLNANDLKKSVTIRGEPHTIIEAINRQITHYAYHVGQIAFMAKHFKGKEWKSLSVPKNKSAEFNEFLAKKADVGREKLPPLDGAMDFGEDN